MQKNIQIKVYLLRRIKRKLIIFIISKTVIVIKKIINIV